MSSLLDAMKAYEERAETEPRECPDDFQPEFDRGYGFVAWTADAIIEHGPQAQRHVPLSLGFQVSQHKAVDDKAEAALRLSAWQALEMVRLGRLSELGLADA